MLTSPSDTPRLDRRAPLDLPTLLDGYHRQAFVFASRRTTLFARDIAWPSEAVAMPDPAQVRALFEASKAGGCHAPLLVGAVPFAAQVPARLGIASMYARSGGLRRTASPGATAKPATVLATIAAPSPLNYERQVAQALARVDTTPLDKVVLARTLILQLDRPLALEGVLQRLLTRNALGYTFAVPLADEQSVFVGATPELLVRRSGNRVILNPLAGSAARCLDPAADRQAATALMASIKDRREHAIMIDAIAQALRPFCRTLHIPAQPALTSTDTLWHLSTTIEGELADPSMTSLQLAYALHPTPAVCGYPTPLAQATIAELESFDRGMFAGFVGWMDAVGDGEWAVSLRCALCAPNQATLYAGAGIVPGSVPASETRETATKFRTMLSALGLERTLAAD